MRVALCIDALGPQPSGIGRYTWELSKGLAKRGEIESLHYYGRGRIIDDPGRLIEDRPLPRRRQIFRPFHDWRLKQILRSSLVHGPNYFLPAHAPTGVITIHDLSVLRFPETHPVERVRAFERLFESSMRRSVHVITDTETIRRELIETFSISPDTVTAVPLGVSDRFRPLSDEMMSEALGAWGLRARGYGLCISTLEPRKKISQLISAWSLLPNALRSDFPLVLAGGSGWENDSLHDEIERAAGEGWLHYLGYVDEAQLPLLYAGAALFAYPSSYEGFGLPPLEAMACGVPVVVANRSCMPEVCGDSVRYVDPDDISGFTSALQDCLLDEDWRDGAIKKGIERSRQFSWHRCVDETLAVYRKVINAV